MTLSGRSPLLRVHSDGSEGHSLAVALWAVISQCQPLSLCFQDSLDLFHALACASPDIWVSITTLFQPGSRLQMLPFRPQAPPRSRPDPMVFLMYTYSPQGALTLIPLPGMFSCSQTQAQWSFWLSTTREASLTCRHRLPGFLSLWHVWRVRNAS